MEMKQIPISPGLSKAQNLPSQIWSRFRCANPFVSIPSGFLEPDTASMI